MSVCLALRKHCDEGTLIWHILESPALERITNGFRLVTLVSLFTNVVDAVFAILEVLGLVRKYGGATGRDICAEIHDIWYSEVLDHVTTACFIAYTIIVILQYVHVWILDRTAEEIVTKQLAADEEKPLIDEDVAKVEDDIAQESPASFFGSWTYSRILIGFIILDISLGFIERPTTIVGGYEPRTWDLQHVNPYFQPLPANRNEVLRQG